jgi:integrase
MMREGAAQEAFDYDRLDEATRELVLRKTHETHSMMERTAEHVVQIGQKLGEVHKLLPETKFSAWLRAEFALSRQTAYTFMRVATKFEGSCKIILQLPATTLYELASSSDAIIQQVENGELASNRAAIRAAKEAERQARAEAETVQRDLSTAQEAIQAHQRTIEQLTHQITSLQEQIAALRAQAEATKEVEKVVMPPEVQAHIETLQQQVQTLKEERDALAHRVTQLGEEAKAAQERGEGEQDRRIRLNWYRVTSEFHAVVSRLLAQWPAPLDTLAFEAEDWTRLSHTRDLAQQFLAAARGHRLEALFILALSTGMRRGELLALKWQDLDLERGTLQVRRILSKIPSKLPGKGFEEAEPKTERGRRSVVLPAFTVEALRRHQLKQVEAKHKAGTAWQEHDYVFCTSVGTHLNPTYHVLGTLKTLLQKAGLPHIRFPPPALPDNLSAISTFPHCCP